MRLAGSASLNQGATTGQLWGGIDWFSLHLNFVPQRGHAPIEAQAGRC